MASISDIKNPWRTILLGMPASFRNVMFHIESGNRASGRRTVLHEYPKRPDNLGPYAEDMGRAARRFQFSGYLIYRPDNALYTYTDQRNKLVAALEQEGPGALIHPVFCQNSSILVMCERYSFSETREKGGYSQFEMAFVEAGTVGNAFILGDIASAVGMNSSAANTAAINAVNKTPTTDASGMPLTGIS